ncbi:MAG: hypothetical protein QUV08_14850 [Parasphingorhabdus sp.]|nr:hypothetical protein [Parasphingorhabdus sp.]
MNDTMMIDFEDRVPSPPPSLVFRIAVVLTSVFVVYGFFASLRVLWSMATALFS